MVCLAFAPCTPRACTPSPAHLATPLSQRLAQLTQAHGGTGRILVGLVGIPGSGKSTVANFAVHGTEHALIQMDGFHLPLAQLDEHGRERRGAPFTFDEVAFVDCLRRVAAGEEVPVPKFDHAKKDPVMGPAVPWISKICLVEGNYLLHWQSVRELLAETWFVDVDLELAMTRVLRRLVRDVGFDLETAKKRILENDAVNAKIILQTRKYADYAINAGTGDVSCIEDGSKVLF